MGRPELGSKRHCMSCGAKFYDLGRDPIVCPKCGTTYQASVAVPVRAAAPAVARSHNEDEIEPNTGDVELVSLEDAEAGDADKEIAIEDDIDLGEDVGGDDAFLEEEEEGEDDVSDLIDGDIEDDEEA